MPPSTKRTNTSAGAGNGRPERAKTPSFRAGADTGAGADTDAMMASMYKHVWGSAGPGPGDSAKTPGFQGQGRGHGKRKAARNTANIANALIANMYNKFLESSEDQAPPQGNNGAAGPIRGRSSHKRTRKASTPGFVMVSAKTNDARRAQTVKPKPKPKSRAELLAARYREARMNIDTGVYMTPFTKRLLAHQLQDKVAMHDRWLADVDEGDRDVAEAVWNDTLPERLNPFDEQKTTQELNEAFSDSIQEKYGVRMHLISDKSAFGRVSAVSIGDARTLMGDFHTNPIVRARIAPKGGFRLPVVDRETQVVVKVQPLLSKAASKAAYVEDYVHRKVNDFRTVLDCRGEDGGATVHQVWRGSRIAPAFLFGCLVRAATDSFPAFSQQPSAFRVTFMQLVEDPLTLHAYMKLYMEVDELMYVHLERCVMTMWLSGYAHCDLHTGNVMMVFDRNVHRHVPVLIDFGYAVRLDQEVVDSLKAEWSIQWQSPDYMRIDNAKLRHFTKVRKYMDGLHAFNWEGKLLHDIRDNFRLDPAKIVHERKQLHHPGFIEVVD
jgi:hypothetical protein